MARTTVRAVVTAWVAGVLAIGASYASVPWTAEGDQEGALFGWSVATAGDVNGDGYADVVVGALQFADGTPGEGRVTVYYGSAAGVEPSPAWSMEGDQYGNFGGCVATAGDVNGDGYSDVLVSAPNYFNGDGTSGRVFLYLGSAGGLSTIPDWVLVSDKSSPGFWSLGTAGDVNGDGYADVIIGAQYYNNEGRAWVYLGSPSGLPSSPAWTAVGQTGSSFGSSVGTAGDVNGDGYADVIVGAPLFDNDQTNEGRALVYLGSAEGLSASPSWTVESNVGFDNAFAQSVSTAGDVNRDGYADVLVGDAGPTKRVFLYLGSPSGLSTSPASTVVGFPEIGEAVGPAGDVNGDGYADVILGARNAGGQTGEGQAHVFLGSATGLEATPVWTVEGDQEGAQLGHSVGMAGDVNGDGLSDVILGAASFDNGQVDEGRVYVYYAPLAVPPPTLGGAVTGLVVKKVSCRNTTTGAGVVHKTSSVGWDCEALGLPVHAGDRVQTSANGRVREDGSPIVGTVTRMTPSSVFCQNLTTGAKLQVQTSATSWDCRALGMQVIPGDQVSTGANGVAE